jgi:hypothetical protein
MTDIELINFVKEKIQKSPYGYYKAISPYASQLEELFKVDFGDFKNNLFHLIHDTKQQPLCEVCNKKVAVFKGISKGYGKTCSKQCSAILGGDGRKKADPNKHIEKMQETNMKIFSAKSPLGNRQIKQKQEQTMLEKYGAKHAVHSPILMQKTKDTIKQRYGVDSWFQSEDGRKMSSEGASLKHQNDHFKTFFRENYGVDSWYQTEDGIRHVLRMKNVEHAFDEIETYLNGDSLTQIGDRLSITPYMVKRIIDFKKIEYKPTSRNSGFEDDIYEFLCTLICPTKIVRNDRSILGNGQEIDLLILEKNIGIECNGIFWHSEEFKEKQYHKIKNDLAEQAGINLIQITDLFYYRNKEKWQNMLRNKLGFSERIFARNLNVKVLKDTKIIREFLDDNHIQGFSGASYYLGLVDGNEKLYAIASFATSRYNRKYDYELIRFSSINDVTVVGGFSKLLSHFTKNYMKNNQTLLSYANCFWSNGNVYEKNGFELIARTDPNYVWTDTKKVLPRYQTQKHKLIKEYGEIVESEVGFMSNVLGMKRYFDAGNKVYLFIKKEG